MPPKFRFTREEIVAAALAVTRRSGISGLTARSLAAELGCSVKPIFGLFKSMEEVQQAVCTAANTLYQNALEQEMRSGSYPPYKASGMAYIRFAREEKELFKLLFMRDRTEEDSETEDESIDGIIALISRNTGLSNEDARLFHLEMWIFVHGIATMIVTGYLDWEEEYVSRTLTDVYEGLKARWCGGNGK